MTLPKSGAERKSQNITVIGLGLIGGSALRAFAAGGHTVTGYDADPATRALVRTAAGQAHPDHRFTVSNTIAAATADAEVAVVAVPWPAVADVIDELANSGYQGLITDVTSVKGAVRATVADRWRRDGIALAGFVGGHPMAGREVSGFAASDAAMFRGRAWALCLEDETAFDDWLEIAALATELGARVVPTTAAAHDRAVATASHVPHLLAAALMMSAAGDPLTLALGAGSFHDGTRVAASPPDLMAAMCGANAAAVRSALDDVLARLDAADGALIARDPVAALRRWFTPASGARQAWPPSPSAPTDLPADRSVLVRLGAAGGWLTDVADDRKSVTAVRPID